MNRDTLPQGWNWVSLKEAGTWYGGGTPSKRNLAFWDGGSIPWLSPKDMGEPTLSGTRDHVTESAVSNSSTKLVPSGSVAFVVRSGILERALPITMVPFATTMNQDMKAISPRSDISASWLRYALIAAEPQLLRHCKKDGTTVASMDTTRMMNWQIPLPSPAEQDRIVNALEVHLSRLDTAEATLSTAREKAQRLRAQAIDNVLRPITISRTSESAAERLSAIVQRRSAMVARRKVAPLPPAYSLDLPPGWVTASVDQLCWSIQYGTSTKAHASPEHGDVPVFRMGNIQDGELDTSHLKFIAADDPTIDGLLLEPGDILFNRTNSAELVGKTAVFHETPAVATFASYLIRARAVDGVAPEWISLIVNSSIGRRYIESVMSQQVGQANVNGTKLAAMPIPITAAGAEEALLGEVTELRAVAARLCTEIDRAADRAVILRRSLLRAASAGELVDHVHADAQIPVTLAGSR
ncbi:restriction endonuclease subunit S [Gordonia sp. Z-3]|uniref:restriction endonuclease subunit S n=1 Tax=Gordonia sp. Z-3 TaxID=3115408 RepID=UPI002E2C040C|nr:restriction endonuclease subunit S [Gordonia sp. Z-3]MED5801131.1 restriction endonuclease subunit S [Gordonia sp. Z-3]